SDRNAKAGFTSINTGTVLKKVAAMPITEWHYKDDPSGVRHVGPMAQDFHAAFGLNGKDDKHISVVDEDGVALAAIQGLNRKVDSQTAALRKENMQLKRQLEKLTRRDADEAALKREVEHLNHLVNQLEQKLVNNAS
ncbi:MAG TPA: tail fiber domain-containing protein, partial [Verrucomicrobiae bacterium]|nr:tail fiber domain-containing protein [Verrucomicrobiae bacterium]